MATAEYNGFDAPSDGVWTDDERATAGWSTADGPIGMEGARGASSRARFPANWQIAADFDPNDHMMQLKGRDYLNVQARLLWFIRDQRALTVAGLARMPYVVRTELVEMDRAQGWAHFRTYVRDVLGNEATMYGSESAKDFADFAEKASTKSVGRALLALGYGTAFAPEMDEGDRVVDSPVERTPGAPQPRPQPQPAPRTAPPARPAPQVVQPQQRPAPKSAGDWNGLADNAFRKRCSAIGWRTVANVEELLAAADATRADGESLRDAAYRTLATHEEGARLAAAAVGKRGN